MRIRLLLYFLFLSAPLFGQVDSMQIYCQQVGVDSVVGQDLLWMYRQRDTLRSGKSSGNIRLVLNSDTLAISDSTSLRYAASLANEFSPLDSIWYPLLAKEIQAFNVQQDSLLIHIRQLGWSMRYLQVRRDLKHQIQLTQKGRSQANLSFHNFQLAADVGLYHRGRYLKRSPRYNRMGQEAKQLGMFWGGDFVGFPDPGHVQRFVNSAELIRRFPALSFEFERYREVYQRMYEKKKAMGRIDLVKDTEALLMAMNRERIGKVCACQYAILPPVNQVETEQALVEVNSHQNWVLIKPRNSNGYFYSLGRWAYLPKN